MNAKGLFATIFLVSTSIFYTVHCTCGVTYLRTCQPSLKRPGNVHISDTKVVGNYAQCIDLCNSNRSVCRAFDYRSLSNGSYDCQMFNTLGRSNCAVTPRTQHYVRVRNLLLDIFAKKFFQIQTIENVAETLTLFITMTLFFMVRVFHAEFYIACFS